MYVKSGGIDDQGDLAVREYLKTHPEEADRYQGDEREGI